MGIKKLFTGCVTKVIPMVYDDSLSYYEAVEKVVQKSNETIDFVNAKGGEIDEKIAEANGVITELTQYDEKVNFAVNSLIDVEDVGDGVNITRRYFAGGGQPPIQPTEVTVAKQSAIDSLDASVDKLNKAVLPNEYEMPVVSYRVRDDKFIVESFNKTNVKEVLDGLKVAIDNITNYCNTYFGRKSTVDGLLLSKAPSKMVAGSWDNSTTYEVGSLCTFGQTLWKCLVQNTDITPVEGEYWTATTVATEIKNSESGGGGKGGIDYSLEEQDTGKKWVDGKTIYAKTIDCGVNFPISKDAVYAPSVMIPDNMYQPIYAKFVVTGNLYRGVTNVTLSYINGYWEYFSSDKWDGSDIRHVYFYVEYTKNV